MAKKKVSRKSARKGKHSRRASKKGKESKVRKLIKLALAKMKGGKKAKVGKKKRK